MLVAKVISIYVAAISFGGVYMVCLCLLTNFGLRSGNPEFIIILK